MLSRAKRFHRSREASPGATAHLRSVLTAATERDQKAAALRMARRHVAFGERSFARQGADRCRDGPRQSPASGRHGATAPGHNDSLPRKRKGSRGPTGAARRVKKGRDHGAVRADSVASMSYCLYRKSRRRSVGSFPTAGQRQPAPLVSPVAWKEHSVEVSCSRHAELLDRDPVGCLVAD